MRFLNEAPEDEILPKINPNGLQWVGSQLGHQEDQRGP